MHNPELELGQWQRSRLVVDWDMRVNLPMDVRNAIHGLEVWPFD